MGVLQMEFDGRLLHFATLAGDEFCRLNTSDVDRLAGIHERLLCVVKQAGVCSRVDVVLPGGRLMAQILAIDPEALLSAVIRTTPTIAASPVAVTADDAAGITDSTTSKH